MSKPDNADQAMLAWFPPNSTAPLTERRPFSEQRHLRGSTPHRKFSFSHKTLSASLKSQTARCDFLDAQKMVLTKALDLEKEDGKHRHFSNPDDIPLRNVAELGKGCFGYVDKVLNTVSYKEYARKQIPRGRTFRKGQEVLKDFERELATLKKLSHIHIVELAGSYTDPSTCMRTAFAIRTLSPSTTTGPTTKTPRYCAPGVAACKPRNSSADIWPLGCVFLEIWSVVLGKPISQLNDHMLTSGSQSSWYYQNQDSVYE
ncbi:hypothetical protein K458DRAFT_407701 [Lentithecium fluviatile CBS 122367]|uniref:Protein kinase domain-containing protein n=1 Tax=Lentithecium fluviatile CBS 122367 TaxID=1168545 RepID=A0A6G1IPI0_9PLEO|nr:hypothetical protein K458DRAFT_407701 [Lentithecium fluviatile CBS 122367]